MADLNYIDRDLEVKIVGQDSTGNTVNYVSADASGNMAVKDAADGPVTPGTVASFSTLVGGQFNTSLPTLTTGQQAALQIDSSGRVIIRPLTSADVVTAAQGTAAALSGKWPVQITDGTNTMPTMDVAARAGFQKITDGTNTAAVKAASTAAATTDTALVVALSPNTRPQTTADTFVTGTLSALGQSVVINCTGCATVGWNTTGTWSGTMTMEVNYGDANWYLVETLDTNIVDTGVPSVITTWTEALNNDPWITNVGGAVQARIRFTIYNSGTATINMNASSGINAVRVYNLQPKALTAGVFGLNSGNQVQLATDASGNSQVVGNVASGVADSGNPVKIGGAYNTTPPILTNGQRGDLQLDSRGYALVNTNSDLATYSASIVNLSPQSAATDFLTIKGSSTKKVIINKVNISGIQTNAGVESFSLIKRSTLNTGGGVGTVVQSQYARTVASSNTATVTVTATGAGNLLVVVAADQDARTITAVSDGTNAFTQATGAAASNGGSNGRADIWYLLSSTAGKTTITVTFSGVSTTKDVYFLELSGNGLAFQLAATTGAANKAATEAGTALTNTAPGLVIGVVVTNGSITASPAATNTQFTNGTIGTGGGSAIAWLMGGVSTYTPSWNDSVTSGAAYANSTAAFTVGGNTVPSISAVPHDSGDAAATASVNRYLSNPTLGSTVGTVRSTQVLIPTATGLGGNTTWTLPSPNGKGIVLNNANESLNLNLNGLTLGGGSLAVDIEWTEQ